MEEESGEKPLSDYALFETFPDDELLKTGLPNPLLPAIRSLKDTKELDALHFV